MQSGRTALASSGRISGSGLASARMMGLGPMPVSYTHLQRLGITRRAANAQLKALVAAQWLRVSGAGRSARHAPGALRQVVQRYPLATLQEDLPWRQDFAPFFELPPEVERLLRHAFTELLNNAVDHSGGQTVTVSLRQTPLQVQLLVSDDGCGIFERIAQGLSLIHI